MAVEVVAKYLSGIGSVRATVFRSSEARETVVLKDVALLITVSAIFASARLAFILLIVRLCPPSCTCPWERSPSQSPTSLS